MADYEVELKFPIVDRAAIVARIMNCGATQVGTATQSDRYFAHPVRSFAKTDEAFRIRSEGEANCLTYKGPLLDQVTKTRQEIELDIASGEEGARTAWVLLRALGFVDVMSVKKERTTFGLSWEGRDFSLAVDRVTDLGDFVEVETLASSNDWEAARDSALRLATSLELTQSERRSYLQMLFDRQPTRSP